MQNLTERFHRHRMHMYCAPDRSRPASHNFQRPPRPISQLRLHRRTQVPQLSATMLHAASRPLRYLGPLHPRRPTQKLHRLLDLGLFCRLHRVIPRFPTCLQQRQSGLERPLAVLRECGSGIRRAAADPGVEEGCGADSESEVVLGYW